MADLANSKQIMSGRLILFANKRLDLINISVVNKANKRKDEFNFYCEIAVETEFISLSVQIKAIFAGLDNTSSLQLGFSIYQTVI